MAHNWMAVCPKCGKCREKKEMRPLFTAETRYHPPKVLCYMCHECFVSFLEEYEISM